MSMSPSQIKIVSFSNIGLPISEIQPFDPIMATAVVETGIGSDFGAGVKSAISGLKAHVKGMDARDFLDPAINRARQKIQRTMREQAASMGANLIIDFTVVDVTVGDSNTIFMAAYATPVRV